MGSGKVSLNCKNRFQRYCKTNEPYCCFEGNSRNPSVDVFSQNFLFKEIFTGCSPHETQLGIVVYTFTTYNIFLKLFLRRRRYKYNFSLLGLDKIL
jgi:hypothetical protein